MNTPYVSAPNVRRNLNDYLAITLDRITDNDIGDAETIDEALAPFSTLQERRPIVERRAGR